MLIYSQRACPNEQELISEISSNQYARLLHDLSLRLAYMGRREYALEAIQEAVGLRRQLAAEIGRASCRERVLELV